VRSGTFLFVALGRRAPPLPARVENRRQLAGFRVHQLGPCPLSKRTRDAGQREILRYRWPPTCHRIDMVDVELSLLAGLRQAAVFTPVRRPAHHSPAQCGRYAHAATGFDLEARSFSSESISANSTNPSASHRSATVSTCPASWRSRSSFSRRCTPAGSRKRFSSPASGSSKWTGSAMVADHALDFALEQVPPFGKFDQCRRSACSASAGAPGNSSRRRGWWSLPHPPGHKSGLVLLAIAFAHPSVFAEINGPGKFIRIVLPRTLTLLSHQLQQPPPTANQRTANRPPQPAAKDQKAASF